MKKIAQLSLSLILSSLPLVSSYGADPKIKLGGTFDFQVGYVDSNAINKISPNKDNFGFSETSSIFVDASNKTDGDVLYGAKIAIVPTTLALSRKAQSSLYLESCYGRLELGSDKSATTKLRISPLTIASASGGLWDVWVKSDPRSTQVPFIVNYSNFLDGKMRARGRNEFSRKITYYTPKFQGFQAGISYIPDSNNAGYAELRQRQEHSPLPAVPYAYAIKDGFAGGFTYEHNFDTMRAFKVSAVGEYGKVKASIKKDAKGKDVTLLPPKNPGKLKTYNIGGVYHHGKFSYAASYANHLRSLYTRDDQRINTSVYGFGARYKEKKYSTSLTFFKSDHRKNKVKAVTLGADYKLAPGLMPYAEVTHFSIKGTKISDPSVYSTHNGTLSMIGARIDF